MQKVISTTVLNQGPVCGNLYWEILISIVPKETTADGVKEALCKVEERGFGCLRMIVEAQRYEYVLIMMSNIWRKNNNAKGHETSKTESTIWSLTSVHLPKNRTAQASVTTQHYICGLSYWHCHTEEGPSKMPYFVPLSERPWYRCLGRKITHIELLRSKQSWKEKFCVGASAEPFAMVMTLFVLPYMKEVHSLRWWEYDKHLGQVVLSPLNGSHCSNKSLF